MVILSVNFNHDGSAVVLNNGRVAAFVNTERFSRNKKHPGIREEDLLDLLDQARIRIGDIDLAILCNLGMNYPEVVERYHTDFKDTWVPFSLDPERGSVTLLGRSVKCVINPDHFLCHAALAYYFSPFDTAVSFAVDPMGSGAYLGHDATMRRLDYPMTQVGNLYTMVSTNCLGFGGLYGAGKTMGLAPYGEHSDVAVTRQLAEMCRDGIGLHEAGALMKAIAEIAERRPVYVESDGHQWNATQAFLVQEVLEFVLDRCLRELFSLARHEAGSEIASLCLSGGTALNSVANGHCFSRSPFRELYLHPACGDDGTAIGAALYYWHHVYGNPKQPRTDREAMYSVRSYGSEVVQAALAARADAIRVDWTDMYIERAADMLADGAIIGWFEGASEIGPRALGHRSIVCSPSAAEMKDRLNSQVKFRESFRPFGPSVLNECAEEWFGLKDSPFMLRVCRVRRTDIPAVTHVDGTARIQTVRREDAPRYYDLIKAFSRRTGLPVVLNTSFNTRSEPIVETPDDALRCFLETGLDAVIFPGCVVRKA
jgi:carbamoyltransferase